MNSRDRLLEIINKVIDKRIEELKDIISI